MASGQQGARPLDAFARSTPPIPDDLAR